MPEPNTPNYPNVAQRFGITGIISLGMINDFNVKEIFGK